MNTMSLGWKGLFRGFGRFVALPLLLLASTVEAQMPTPNSPAPRCYGMKVGQYEVAALADGIMQLPARLLYNVPETEVRDLLTAASADDSSKLVLSVNAYLIKTGKQRVLIDAGSGGTHGRLVGNLGKSLELSGCKPEQIDAVLITHLHYDHVDGLVDARGKPAFAKAVVYVAKPENDYWLSDAEPHKVAPIYRNSLPKVREMVRKTAAPYLAEGRWKTFEGANLPIEGVKAVATPGHTPGHTAYVIESEGKSLWLVGDLLVSGPVQFAKPTAAWASDTDAKEAVITRASVLAQIAKEKAFMAATHLAFPGIGQLRSEGNGAFRFVPIE